MELLTLHATGADAGKNGCVTYSILSGNELGLFPLGFISGVLATAQMVDRETFAFTLLIMAQDAGFPFRLHLFYRLCNIIRTPCPPSPPPRHRSDFLWFVVVAGAGWQCRLPPRAPQLLSSALP